MTAIITSAASVTILGIISAHVAFPFNRLNDARSTQVDSLLTTIPAF